MQKKIQQLFADIKQHPFDGIGKPKALKHGFTGKWPRRINKNTGLFMKYKQIEILVYSPKGYYTI